MQIMSCGVQEELLINGRITVTVLDIQEDHVVLGITDPDQHPAYREEVFSYETEVFSPEFQLQ